MLDVEKGFEPLSKTLVDAFQNYEESVRESSSLVDQQIGQQS
jgi:hypothetical protein